MVKRNIELNQVSNYEYMEGNVEDNMDKYLKKGNSHSIVINPPRRGLYEPLIHYINNHREYIRDMVYVSCNMESLKRDLDLFGVGWYVEKIIPLDQFPNTNHCEIIVKMDNKML